ncbi:MAG: photosynthetic complex putative assembly protein PuhB [Burkholderiaceae bacterium]
MKPTVITEHGLEKIPGVPADLPPGEFIIWRGQPMRQSVTRHALHTRKVALYFGLLAAWGAFTSWTDGLSLGQGVAAVSWTLLLGISALALLKLIGWGVAKTTYYTLTNKRVILRIGITLPVTMNIPFKVIEAVAMRERENGRGDIVLTLSPQHRIAYALLWPHAKPWHLTNPEPMLRSLEDVRSVGEVFQTALQGQLRAAQTKPVETQAQGQKQSDTMMPAPELAAAR